MRASFYPYATLEPARCLIPVRLAVASFNRPQPSSLLYGSRHGFAQMHDMHAMGLQSQPASATAKPTPMLHVLELPPFVDPLPLPKPAPQHAPGKLSIEMREIRAQVHRDLKPTRMWSYGPTPLGPIIEARTNQPLQINWVNNLAHDTLSPDRPLPPRLRP